MYDPQTKRHYAPDQRHEEFIDANLVLAGEHQAYEVGKLLKKQVSRVDFIVTSPLTRCLQTALIAMQAFNDDKNLDRKLYPEVFSFENLREPIGNSFANKRARRSVLQVRHLALYYFQY